MSCEGAILSGFGIYGQEPKMSGTRADLPCEVFRDPVGIVHEIIKVCVNAEKAVKEMSGSMEYGALITLGQFFEIFQGCDPFIAKFFQELLKNNAIFPDCITHFIPEIRI